MNESMEVLDIIRNYLAEVAHYLDMLRATSGEGDLLSAVRKKRIRKSGVLSDGCRYHFHGKGCWFESPIGFFDFDFGPDQRQDVFEAHRIREYVRSVLKMNEEEVSDSWIDSELHRLSQSGQIKSIGTWPKQVLYYIAEDSELK